MAFLPPQQSALPPWITGPIAPEQWQMGQVRPVPNFDVRARGGGGGAMSSRAGGIFNQNTRPVGQPQGAPAAPQYNPLDDYRTIFSGYQSILNRGPVTPQQTTYQESPEAQQSLNLLSNLARTGGLSEQEQSSIRARGISPIRAAYANAQRNLSRRSNIAGGYAPGLGAATARMAREQGELASQGATNVEAALAEMIQRGRLAATPQYEAATGQRTAALNAIAEQNAQRRQRADEFGTERSLQALQGMGSIYGATPGLAEYFGRQTTEQGRALIDAYLRARGRA